MQSTTRYFKKYCFFDKFECYRAKIFEIETICPKDCDGHCYVTYDGKLHRWMRFEELSSFSLTEQEALAAKPELLPHFPATF